jgi:hypothetical protein
MTLDLLRVAVKGALTFFLLLIVGLLLDLTATYFLTGNFTVRAPVVIVIVAASLTVLVKFQVRVSTRPKA